MRLLILALALLLVGCGGPAPSSPPRPDSDVEDGIETPWSKSQANRSQAPPPLLLPRQEPRVREAARGSRASGRAAIDFAVKDTDLHDAFRLLAETAKINIVVADSVAGRVSLRVRQVSWLQILNTLVNMKKLTLSEKNGIYYVQ